MAVGNKQQKVKPAGRASLPGNGFRMHEEQQGRGAATKPLRGLGMMHGPSSNQNHAAPAPVPSDNLAEILWEVRRFRQPVHAQGVMAKDPSRDPSILLEPARMELEMAVYGLMALDAPMARPYGMPGSFSLTYQHLWYHDQQTTTSSGRSSGSGDAGLSMDDLQEIQKDAKLKNWGWGGSGHHLSVAKQEMYKVVKAMSSTFAWNTVLYQFALR